MYMNEPVKIPAGKITYKRCGETDYVQYETGRRYDPNRKYNLVDRVVIGLRMPDRPDMMLPNENYQKYFPDGARDMSEEKAVETEAGAMKIKERTATMMDDVKMDRGTAAGAEDDEEAYRRERERKMTMRELFEQMFYEFQILSRKKPGTIINEYKAEILNQVLEPLMEMMQEMPGAEHLRLIDMPETIQNEDGSSTVTGMSYSDIALLLTQYKGTINRYFMKIV